MDQITVTAYVTALATLARWTAGAAADWQAELAIAGLRNAGFIKPDALVTKQNWPLQVSRLDQQGAWAQAYADMWGTLRYALLTQSAFYAMAPAAEQVQLAEAIQDAQKAITIAQVATGQGGNGSGGGAPPPKKPASSGPIIAIGVVAVLGGLALFASRKAK